MLLILLLQLILKCAPNGKIDLILLYILVSDVAFHESTQCIGMVKSCSNASYNKYINPRYFSRKSPRNRLILPPLPFCCSPKDSSPQQRVKSGLNPSTFLSNTSHKLPTSLRPFYSENEYDCKKLFSFSLILN